MNKLILLLALFVAINADTIELISPTPPFLISPSPEPATPAATTPAATTPTATPTTASASNATAPATEAGLSLKWSDEFNGNTVDWTKWTAHTGVGHTNELEYYTGRPQNAFVSNGMLTIQSQKKAFEGSQYTSARLETAGKFAFTYGRVEARIKVPSGLGAWAAFWMLGADKNTIGWPACGEIDIMQITGKDVKTNHASTHATGWDTSHSAAGIDFSQNFHVYGVNWTQNQIQFYVDGKVYQTVVPVAAKPWPFNTNFYIILNLAIGGTWPGSPDLTAPFSQELLVDYVRVYQ